MALPFEISWMCTLLFCGCICFLPQNGSNIAHGFSLYADEFSNHADVPRPQISDQFNSGASLNENYGSVSQLDEMQPMRHTSFVSPQREPVHHENNEAAGSDARLNQVMVQSKPDSGHEQAEFSAAPSTPSVQKYEHETSGHQHPFGTLVKGTQRRTMDGISFPTMADFKRFIETMKSAFLIPGSDVNGHFQTARKFMENEVASKFQNMEGEADTGYRPNSAKEGAAPDDTGENEVWSEHVNPVFEQSKDGARDQMPSGRLSVSDPVYSPETPTAVYDNQDLGPALTLDTQPNLAATEHLSGNYEVLDNSVRLRQNPDIYTSAPDVQNADLQATSYKVTEQMPSASFFRDGYSSSGYVTISPVNPPNSPSQDFNYSPTQTSNIKPLTSESKIQQPKFKPHSKGSLTWHQKPSADFEKFQKEEEGTVTPAKVHSASLPPSLTSYGKSVHVRAPKGQFNIQDYVPKHRERPAPTYQPAAGKESKDEYNNLSINLPESGGSASSSSQDFSSQSRDAQGPAPSRQQPIRPDQVFTVKPSSSPRGSSRHDGYLGDQRVGVTYPLILTNQVEVERSDVYPVSAIQEPKQVIDDTLDYASLTNLAPTSASETLLPRLFGNEVTSRNKNVIPQRFLTGDIRGARNPLGSFSTAQKRDMSLNGGYVGAVRAGFPQNFIQQTRMHQHPASVTKTPGGMAFWPTSPLLASKVSASTLNGVFWRDGGSTKRSPPQSVHNMSTPSQSYVVKSRKGYVRSKVSLSKTHYAPHRLNEVNTGKRKWTPRQHNHKNAAKGSEEHRRSSKR